MHIEVFRHRLRTRTHYTGLHPESAAYTGLHPESAAYTGLHPESAAYTGLHRGERSEMASRKFVRSSRRSCEVKKSRKAAAASRMLFENAEHSEAWTEQSRSPWLIPERQVRLARLDINAQPSVRGDGTVLSPAHLINPTAHVSSNCTVCSIAYLLPLS